MTKIAVLLMVVCAAVGAAFYWNRPSQEATACHVCPTVLSSTRCADWKAMRNTGLVVLAKNDIPAGKVITLDDVRVTKLPVDKVPETALPTTSSVTNRKALNHIKKDSIISVYLLGPRVDAQAAAVSIDHDYPKPAQN